MDPALEVLAQRKSLPAICDDLLLIFCTSCILAMVGGASMHTLPTSPTPLLSTWQGSEISMAVFMMKSSSFVRSRGTCLQRLISPSITRNERLVSGVGTRTGQRSAPVLHGRCLFSPSDSADKRIDRGPSARHVSMLNSSDTVFALSSGHGKCGKVSGNL